MFRHSCGPILAESDNRLSMWPCRSFRSSQSTFRFAQCQKLYPADSVFVAPSRVCALCLLQIVSVDADAGVLVLRGVDIVDGSPVLDIKPYVPFSDALPCATAPSWVTVSMSLFCSPPAHMQHTCPWVWPDACAPPNPRRSGRLTAANIHAPPHLSAYPGLTVAEGSCAALFGAPNGAACAVACCGVLCLQAAADEEPLALSGVTISTAAAEEIAQAWQAVAPHSLYSSPQQLLDLVQQVCV